MCYTNDNKTSLISTKSNTILQLQVNTLETTVECVGSSYNQSCLFRNLYYVDSAFMILIVNGSYLPSFSLRTDAFSSELTIPNQRVFSSYADLEKFVRTVIDVKILSGVTLHFGQPWHRNIGHALFDGLYSAYVTLIRFSPRHLLLFRILAKIDECNYCWSEDIYSRFGGLGILKYRVLDLMSKGNWFMFEEIVMGSGASCQRCTQPNLQLPGGVELDASRLFRDRMYYQHGVIQPITRKNSSSERRTPNDLLLACIIDNKRYTSEDRQQIYEAINEINNYTDSFLNRTNKDKLPWPLVRVSYVFYSTIRRKNPDLISVKPTKVDSRSPIYELVDNKFISQLKLLRQMDIQVTGPGTAQMYQTFLPDGSVFINLGGIRPLKSDNTNYSYTSYMEQYMTSGTPYIKGLYYPINERPFGIKKEQVIKLIREASQLILQGFPLPVNPRENLAPDGQLFVEMCEKDKEFCASVITRSENRTYDCFDFWAEDFVHEYRQWKLGGFLKDGINVSCPFNRSLLHELREKYGIIK